MTASDGDEPQAALLRGREALLALDVEEARHASVTALQRPSLAPEARVIHAVALVAGGDFAAALRFLDVVDLEEPGQGWTDYLRAIISATQGDQGLTRHFLGSCLRADPGLKAEALQHPLLAHLVDIA